MKLFSAILVPCAVMAGGISLAAQSRGTAVQGIRLQGYALATFARPDFLGARRNAGGTVGVNVNAFRFGRLEPSLDLRAMGTGGSVSNQFFYGAGPRVVAHFDRVQPYGEFLIGDGIIRFVNAPTNYTHDNCLAKVYGGGADVRVNRDFSVRAEVLRQSWQLSTRNAPFHPLAVSVGVRYQLHFRGKGGPDL